MSKIRRHSFHTWTAFKTELFPTLFGGGHFEPDKYFFRGVGDADWTLRSSFDRHAGDISVGQRAAAAERLLQAFAEECEADPAIEACPDDPERRLAVAQHYELPTRALDWTESPYIAAHFAFADVGPGDRSGQVAVWALALEHEAWQNQGATFVRISSRGENERLLRQRGALSYLRAPYDTLEEHVETCGGDESTALFQFRLPRSEAGVALADLRAMGITSTRLFPDRTGAARAAIARCLR